MYYGKQFIIFRDAVIKCMECSFECIEPAGMASLPNGYSWKESNDMKNHTEKTNHKEFDVSFA